MMRSFIFIVFICVEQVLVADGAFGVVIPVLYLLLYHIWFILEMTAATDSVHNQRILFVGILM